jgi:hypothetical protein
MGLMYMFPVTEDEQDRIDYIEENGTKAIVLKTYGLPLIFWGYLVAILTVVGAMYLAIKSPLEKLIATGDSLNIYLSYLVLATIILLPFTLVAMYFYEKLLTKKGDELIITHRFFWIPVWQKKLSLKSADAIELNHFLDSPNVAKMRKDSAMKGFENKGYFEVFATTINDKKVFVDRHNRKADMSKLAELLKKY